MTGETQIQAKDPQPGGREPAPGELGLVQSFLNTRWNLRDERHRDLFETPRALADWLVARDLTARRARLDQDDLGRAVAVREGLRALAFANNGHEANERALAALREASRGASTGILIEPEGPRFVAAHSSAMDSAIGALLAVTARAMLEGTWHKLKACPGRDCGWVFYDKSRNQSARWCSMKVCGDREKSRAYYRRRTERL